LAKSSNPGSGPKSSGAKSDGAKSGGAKSGGAKSSGAKSGTTGSSPKSASTREHDDGGESLDAPPKSSSLGYGIGALIFAVLIAALLYSRCSEDKQATNTQPVANKPAPSPSEVVQADLPEFAPPPPPEEDAGSDAGPEAADAGVASKTAPAGSGGTPGESGACAKCGQGEASSALVSAVQSTGASAQGCYNRALRAGGAEGRLSVAVSIGSNGSVCGANITSDTVGDPAISQCVLGKFRGRSYPKPTSGCVVINQPISFKVRG
jgi:hypothetical protein